MKNLIKFIAVFFLFITFGCSSAYKSIRATEVAPIEIAPLKRNEYVIMNEVEGNGQKSSIFGLLLNMDAVVSLAQRDASFQAVSKVEGADMLIAPRYEIETFNFLGIYKQAKVKVKAKAIRIKASNEN